MILKEFANMHNLKADEAENGKIALQMYKDSLLNACWNGYKLILMDLNMPVMDGITSAQRILQEKTTMCKTNYCCSHCILHWRRKRKML